MPTLVNYSGKFSSSFFSFFYLWDPDTFAMLHCGFDCGFLLTQAADQDVLIRLICIYIYIYII